MNIQDYISSGILELYALGQLTPAEMQEVETMAAQHVEIKQELHYINLGLEKYAMANSISAPATIKERLFKELPPKNIPSPKTESVKPNNLVGNLVLGGVLATALILFFNQRTKYNDLKSQYEKEKVVCDSIQTEINSKYQFVDDIRKEGNDMVQIAATPKYANTIIYLHTNKAEKINYLQLNNLPPLAAGQAYQLWSLQEGKDPVPMEVFKDADTFVKVGFFDATVNYAITIEKDGGSQVPNLENLVGTFKAG